MPYTLPLSVVVAFTILQRSQIVQVLVRPHGVVDMRPGLQLDLMLVQPRGDLPHLVELLAVRTLRPLDMALQFGAVRRDDEEEEAARCAGRLKRAPKLTAAVDLQRADRKGMRRTNSSRKAVAVCAVARP